MRTFISALLLLSSALFFSAGAQNTYCNPIDINYQYNFEQLNEGISYRSAADPVIVLHQNAYYLFATISGGYWRSTDLSHWQYIRPSRWPFEDNCAPAAWSMGDTLLVFQSTMQQRPILYSTRPETGRLEFYNRWLPLMPGAEGPWDPALFRDNKSGRWFMYFGSSNLYPVYGIELDPAKRLAYKGKALPLLYLHPDQHGWERFGPNHTADTIKPFIEGAWMTEHGGKYYLQYGAPGTEYNVYANGVYVGDNPLGPFNYAPYNPLSYKPGGFMAGAGHGNTFADRYGNYWNTGTPWVAVNWNFERRVAMFPAGFDADGQMFSSTRFGDFPHFVPNKKVANPDSLFTGWMLLSYKKYCTASSQRDTFRTANASDENPRTYWVASKNQPGEWLQIDLGKRVDVYAVQVNFTDYQSGLFASDSSVYTQFRILCSRNQVDWDTLADFSQSRSDRSNPYIPLDKPVNTRYIRYDHVHVSARNLAISDLRVFGKAAGAPPETPQGLRVIPQSDKRNCLIVWQRVPQVVGYNIRWGIAPDKLYQCYQIWGDAPNTLMLRALNLGVPYYFAIEAFNESGVSPLGTVVKM